MREFDLLIDRVGTSSQKWNKYRDTDILPMWVADTDFKAPQPVIDALHQRVEHGVFGYTEAPDSLTDAIVQRMQRLYDWQIESEWVVYLSGLVPGLNLVTRAFTGDTDAVISAKPIYPPFMLAPKFSQRTLVTVPMLLQDQRWVIDFTALEAAAARPEARLLLFCNPHNPGGTIYREEELQRLAEIALRHDLLVCSDEIHCDLLLDAGKPHIPLATLDDAIARRTVTLMAPSKTFNIAGLTCAFAIIPDATVRQRFIRTKRGLITDINLLGYAAAEAAYREGDPWLVGQLDYLRANRDYLLAEIDKMPGLSCQPIEATYLAWIDASGLGVADPHAFFEQAGVGLSPGRDFGAPQFIRLNFGCPRSLLEEAVRRMGAALDKHFS